MLKNMMWGFIGLLVGALAMGGTSYYLFYHDAWNMMPWILAGIALILVLLCVIGYLESQRRIHKLQKQANLNASASAGTADFAYGTASAAQTKAEAQAAHDQAVTQSIEDSKVDPYAEPTALDSADHTTPAA